MSTSYFTKVVTFYCFSHIQSNIFKEMEKMFPKIFCLALALNMLVGTQSMTKVIGIHRPLVFNTICIFITFEKYLYWVFSIHLRKNVFVLINTFLPASILFVSILFMNNFFVKSIKIESLSYQITLINLSYSNKNKEKFIHILEFEFW